MTRSLARHASHRPLARLAAVGAISLVFARAPLPALPTVAWLEPEPPIELEDAAQLFPPSVAAVAEAIDLGAVAEGFPTSALWARIQDTDAYKRFLLTPEAVQSQLVLGAIELVSGVPSAEAIGKLLGRRLLAAFFVDESIGEPALLLAFECADARTAEDVIGWVKRLSEMGDENQLRTGRHRGVEGVSLNGDFTIAAIGHVVVAANTGDVLKSVVDRVRDGTPSLHGSEQLAQLQQLRGEGDVAALLDNQRVTTLREGQRLIPERLDQPLASLLLGDLLEAASRADTLSAVLDVTPEGDDLHLRLDVPVRPDELPEAFGFIDAASTQDRPLHALWSDHAFASMSLRRDIAEFWLQRQALLEEETEKGFAEFESGLGTFFAGRSIADEVWPAIGDDLLLVGSRQTFAGHPSPPRVRYPAGAVILQLREPKFAREVAAAFGSMIGIINIDRGQKGQTPMLMFADPIGDSVCYGGRFLTEDDRPYDPARYNVSPAMATVGDLLVLGTAEELVKELVERLQESGDQAFEALSPGITSALTLTGAEVLTILEENREALVANNQLEESNTRREAEREIDLLLEMVGQAHSLSLETRADAAGYALSVGLQLARPDADSISAAMEGGE